MIILSGVKTGPLPPSYIQRDNMNMSFLPGCFERWANVTQAYYIVSAGKLPGSLIEENDEESMSLEQASVAIATISASTYAIHNSDPSIEEIGDPAT
jgi:hypothetical protein